MYKIGKITCIKNHLLLGIITQWNTGPQICETNTTDFHWGGWHIIVNVYMHVYWKFLKIPGYSWVLLLNINAIDVNFNTLLEINDAFRKLSLTVPTIFVAKRRGYLTHVWFRTAIPGGNMMDEYCKWASFMILKMHVAQHLLHFLLRKSYIFAAERTTNYRNTQSI